MSILNLLTLPRTGLQPLDVVRKLSMLQDRIAAGDADSFERQNHIVAEIDIQLKAFPLDVWKDARNRMALIKFTSSGGNPEVLRFVAEKRLFSSAEVSLAHGTLAYAEGHKKAALTYLTKFGAETLGPSLAGQVTFINAILVADTDVQAALRLSDRARLLSPGTLIEEASLRLSLELAIAAGDKRRFEADAARYLRRFQRSKFSIAVVPLIAAFVAKNDYPISAERKVWLEHISVELGPSKRAEFFIFMAEHALRFGKFATAAHAARIAAASGADRALALAYEGAAMVVSPDPSQWLALVTASEALTPPPEIAKLLAAARMVGSLIQAPPTTDLELPSLAAQPTSSPQATKVRKAISDVDTLLNEAVE